MPGGIGGQVEHGAAEQTGNGGDRQVATFDINAQIAAEVGDHGRHVVDRSAEVDGLKGGFFLCLAVETHKGEQLFDQVADPHECHNLAPEPAHRERLQTWRDRMIETLRDRPEGFTDGEQLIPGREYPGILPHVRRLE